MANHVSALKRHRQSLKRRARNRAVKTRIKNVVKNVREALDKGDEKQAREALTIATGTLDKATSKGVIHWRTAGRKISRLHKAVNKIS